MRLYLVHHGDAVGPDVDIRRPLSEAGRRSVERLASAAADLGTRPAVVWHSGKLRARQTAEAYWRACNALAEFGATRDLQSDDPPGWMRDRLRFESRDVLLAGRSLGRLQASSVPYVRRNLGVVLQEPRLLSRRTVYQNVAVALEVLGLPKDEERVDVFVKAIGEVRSPGQLVRKLSEHGFVVPAELTLNWSSLLSTPQEAPSNDLSEES
mgnify:CR=1 FL=1